MTAVDTPAVPQQHSKMQRLLQEQADAPGYVPDAAAARTAAPDAPLEPLGPPMMMSGAATTDEPLTPQPTPMGLTPSPLMGSFNPSAAPGADRSTFEPSSIDAVAAEAAAAAVEQRQQLLRDSPPSSAYYTPASGMSAASSRTGSVTGATAGRGSIDTPSSMGIARSQFPAGGAAAAPSSGGVAETGGGEGLHVHVGQGMLVTEGVPAGTDFDGAVLAANRLADAMEAELPPKAFDELARPAGLVDGQPVSPHAHLAPDSSSTAFGMTPRDIPHPTSGTPAVISHTGLQHDVAPSTCCGLCVCANLQLIPAQLLSMPVDNHLSTHI